MTQITPAWMLANIVDEEIPTALIKLSMRLRVDSSRLINSMTGNPKTPFGAWTDKGEFIIINELDAVRLYFDNDNEAEAFVRAIADVYPEGEKPNEYVIRKITSIW